MNIKQLKRIISEELKKTQEDINSQKLIYGKYSTEETYKKAIQEFNTLKTILLSETSAINLYLGHLYNQYLTGKLDSAVINPARQSEIKAFLANLEKGLQTNSIKK